MRKTRSEHDGERHPTLEDPSPLDACGWCLRWIAEQEEPGFAPLSLQSQPPVDSLLIDLSIDDHPVIAIVPVAAGVGDVPGTDAVVMLCSEECDAALQAAVANDAARALGEPVPRRVATAEERVQAEALLKNHCAWCRQAIADDAPVETVSASLHGEVSQANHMIALDIAGRSVHALVPPPGFPMQEGHDVLFVLCSGACAAALVDAATAEKSVRTIH